MLQVGLGPLGIKIAMFISERSGISTISAVDRKQELIGRKLSDLDSSLSESVEISSNIREAIHETSPDVVILTTVSNMKRVTPQIIEIVKRGVPVVSTCEELSYPWECSPELSQLIDSEAKENQVAVVGTGINPGFLMDSLPSSLTSVCQQVEKIEVNRFQNAA